MDAPYENPRTTTALRLMDIAVKRGYDVNVFAYEGAVNVAFHVGKYAASCDSVFVRARMSR